MIKSSLLLPVFLTLSVSAQADATLNKEQINDPVKFLNDTSQVQTGRRHGRP